jgi:hypothetical protein
VLGHYATSHVGGDQAGRDASEAVCWEVGAVGVYTITGRGCIGCNGCSHHRTIPVLFPLHLSTLSDLQPCQVLNELENTVASRLMERAKQPGSALMAQLLALKRGRRDR